MNTIQKLGMLVEELGQYVPQYEMLDAPISSSPVDWHIEHSLLVLDQVIDQMIRSDPGRYKKVFDYRRSIVLVFGYIPRKKIKAPKAVQPAGLQDASSLHLHIENTKQKIEGLTQMSKGHYFTHPFLGDFRLKPAIRFLCVHTLHHLGIIEEIVSAQP